MKIGILTFACDAGRSGIGQYLVHLLRELPSVAPDVEIEVIGHRDEMDSLLPADHTFTLHTIGDQWKRPIRNIVWQNVVLPRLCLTRGYDALFLPAANRRVPLWLPCPTVGTVHDFSSMHVEGKYDPLRDVYIKRVLPFLVRRLSRVIAVSECTKGDIFNFARYPTERIAVIPHGVDHDTYYQRDKADSQKVVGKKYGLRDPYILYVSRIEHPGKNHARLIRAFAKLKRDTDLPHQLVLAGSDWNRAEEVHKEAEAAGLGDDIRFTGFVDHKDLAHVYCGADLFVFPSLFEGFGMPILEAMACGIPVACSEVSSLPEVAGDAAVYFNPNDEKAIADSIHGTLADASTLSHLTDAGRKHAAGFSWGRATESTMHEIVAATDTDR